MKRNKTRRRGVGQGLTEYLILVALMGISAIAIIRATSVSLKNGFARIANALNNDDKETGVSESEVSSEKTRGRNMTDFSSGVKN